MICKAHFIRQDLSCSMYPQGRCVPVPTIDPISYVDHPENWSSWGFHCSNEVLPIVLDAVLESCKVMVLYM